MADNSTLPAAGDVIATDDIAGVKHQLVKVEFGAADSATQVSPVAGLPIVGGQSAVASAAWTSATGVNATNSINVSGYNTVTVAMANTSTMTAGVLTFEVSPDGGTNWFPIAMARIDSYTVETTYTLNTVANRAWSTSVDGFTNFRVRLSTVITGSGTANVFVTAEAMAIEPIVSVGQANAANLQATAILAAGTADVGGVTARRDLLAIRVNSGGLTIVTTAYTAGDQTGTQFTLPNAARASGGTGTIIGVTLTDANDVIGAFDVVFTNASISLAADNAAYAISDADALKVIGIAQLAGAFDIGNNRVAQQFNLAIPYDCVGSTSLFASLITRTANAIYTAVTDLQLTVWVERN